jgi:hypothetical protein
MPPEMAQEPAVLTESLLLSTDGISEVLNMPPEIAQERRF